MWSRSFVSIVLYFSISLTLPRSLCLPVYPSVCLCLSLSLPSPSTLCISLSLTLSLSLPPSLPPSLLLSLPPSLPPNQEVSHNINITSYTDVYGKHGEVSHMTSQLLIRIVWHLIACHCPWFGNVFKSTATFSQTTNVVMCFWNINMELHFQRLFPSSYVHVLSTVSAACCHVLS